MSAFTFDALGTRWEIETGQPLGRPLEQRILERVERFDATYSRFRLDSLVAQVATAADGGRLAFPEDFRASLPSL